MGFGVWDLGGCNCGCAATPCTLPETNLSLSFIGPSGSGIGGGPDPFVYSSPCTWNCCFDTRAGSASSFTLQVIGGVLVGTLTDWTGFNCTGTPTTPFATATLISSSCSPLNLVYQVPTGHLGTFYQFTITL
jgi:hypothetical protein